MPLLLTASFVTLVLILGKDASAYATSKQEKLTNKHLVIAVEPWPPFVAITKGADGKIQVEGIGWELIKFWQYARNLTYTVVRSSDEYWGRCSEPNNCTGHIGMVNRHEVDFALGKYQGC